ncbi:hypothetical protein FE784_22940 [Paenibacillus hemerocallicola]|uniref:Uncharacterized protein n=1 Tax=Paenibacillus hemerocallicola TaxID=1172614 RepID=A0A5C4T491_9BACL|nr:hypothetical protein [Paenibacillus hemerocallicola]TNJ63888.1 hypothetical protein FE784_22940 [Paenibacillus hemerocallicola]
MLELLALLMESQQRSHHMAGAADAVEKTVASVREHDADRLFLLISGEGRSRSEARLLTESQAWQNLYAFRSGNIHLAEAKWNYDDSLTRHRLLPVLPHILASRL